MLKMTSGGKLVGASISNCRFNADANTGHAFGIFMASVGALRASRSGAVNLDYKGITAKSTKPLRAGLPETRLSSVQAIQPTHTKPATDRGNKVRTAKLQPVFAAAV
jgi:hypothetical protein